MGTISGTVLGCYCTILLFSNPERIPAKTKKMPTKINDSQRPILSLASFILAINLGICSKRNQPKTIQPESNAANFLV